ncbi:hypothetical protein L917_10010, partial [Phytophthora nicotianae]
VNTSLSWRRMRVITMAVRVSSTSSSPPIRGILSKAARGRTRMERTLRRRAISWVVSLEEAVTSLIWSVSSGQALSRSGRVKRISLCSHLKCREHDFGKVGGKM